jgi:hypothetical protein
LFSYSFLQLLTLTSCLWQQKRLKYCEGLQFFRIPTVTQYHVLECIQRIYVQSIKRTGNCHVDSAQYESLHFFFSDHILLPPSALQY